MLVLLRPIEQHLMAALALYDLALGPELRVELDDDADHLAVLRVGVPAPDLEPLLAPLFVLIAELTTQLDA